MEIVKHLATNIGFRLAGSKGEKTAAKYVASKFEELGLDVRLERFNFIGWELLDEPVIEFLSPKKERVVCAPNIFSSSTPEGGAEGILKLVGKTRRGEPNESDKYAIMSNNGEELAYVIATNQPMARNSVHDIRFPFPEVNVDIETKEILKSFRKEGKKIRMRLQLRTKIDPQAVSYNVIGTLEGEDPDRIIIITSHHDAQVNTVGANDNAAGIEILYNIAQEFVKKKPSKTIKFCSFGCEEIGLFGSRYYANRLKETGDLKKVEFVLCYDEVGRIEQAHRFRATSEWLQMKLNNILDSVEANEKLGEDLIQPFPSKWMIRAFGSDHAAFVEEGIPAISIGGGQSIPPYSHSGSSGDRDTLDKVSPDIIECKTDVGLKILEEIGV